MILLMNEERNRWDRLQVLHLPRSVPPFEEEAPDFVTAKEKAEAQLGFLG